jgi:hypothetical protein
MRSQCVEKENPYRCSWFCPHFYPDCRGERIGGLTPGRAPPSRPGWQQGRHAPYLSAPSVIKALDPAPPLQLQEEIKSSASVPRTLTGTHQIFFLLWKILTCQQVFRITSEIQLGSGGFEGSVSLCRSSDGSRWRREGAKQQQGEEKKPRAGPTAGRLLRSGQAVAGGRFAELWARIRLRPTGQWEEFFGEGGGMGRVGGTHQWSAWRVLLRGCRMTSSPPPHVPPPFLFRFPPQRSTTRPLCSCPLTAVHVSEGHCALQLP